MFKRIYDAIFHRKELETRRRNARHVSTISFLLGFTDSFFAYVLSLYFAEVLGSDNVGGFYLVAFGTLFIVLWFLHRIIHRIGGSVLLFFLATLGAVVLAATLSVVPTGWGGAVTAVLLLMTVNVAWVSLDVVLEQASDDHVTGRLRGLFLTVMNTGILLAPFFATRVVDRFGFAGVFFGVTLGLSIVLAVALILLRRCNGCESTKMRPQSAWRKMLGERNLFHIYGVSFGLEFFYVITMIYTPIHLYRIGFSYEEIGLLLTIMLLPFIFLQYPLGLLADKRFGEREFLIGSVAIALLSVLAFGVFSDGDFVFWGIILFVSRIGAAGMEVMRDSYFYKHVEGDDDDLIAFFRTTKPMANIFGAVIALPLLLFFPLPSVFIMTAVVMLFSLYSAFAIDDTK